MGYSAGSACFIVASIISDTALIKEWSFETSTDAGGLLGENSPAHFLAQISATPVHFAVHLLQEGQLAHI
jgi:hypothetical protein